MDLELGGKSVVITGGARGIGFACAEGFVREGARVAIFDRSTEDLAEAETKLRAMGADFITRELDVADAAAVEAAHADVIERFGGIDVGFNNAGIASRFKPIEDTTDEDWDSVLAVNLRGIFLCVRAQVRHMKPLGRGVIINTASNVAFAGAPGATPYVAAKHGIVGITRTVALELAKTGVRINTIAPGAIQSHIGRRSGFGTFVDPYPDALIRQGLPIGRLGQPHEIADGVLWLASPRSTLAVGETLVMDGGFLAQ